jgi:uncharacterized membrane protein (DUF485 family)
MKDGQHDLSSLDVNMKKRIKSFARNQIDYYQRLPSGRDNFIAPLSLQLQCSFLIFIMTLDWDAYLLTRLETNIVWGFDIGAMVPYIFTYRDSTTIRIIRCDVHN